MFADRICQNTIVQCRQTF